MFLLTLYSLNRYICGFCSGLTKAHHLSDLITRAPGASLATISKAGAASLLFRFSSCCPQEMEECLLLEEVKSKLQLQHLEQQMWGPIKALASFCIRR